VTDVFERIACCLDGTNASVEGLRQAAHLAHAGSHLVLVTVEGTSAIVAAAAGAGGMAFPPTFDEDGEDPLAPGLELLKREFTELKASQIETRRADGPVIPALLGTIADEKATLAVAGRHRHSRIAGLVLGSVATSLIHDAPCSVLIAGDRSAEGPFPRSIVVGFDASPASEPALAVAVELARRRGASLEAVCAKKGKDVDVDRIRERLTELAPDVRLTVVDGGPAEALAHAHAELVVVGSRGLHGFGSLGSVSERVAHGADSSVLVVHESA
jgi:nucleotide-binding universal stress UspA family protein